MLAIVFVSALNFAWLHGPVITLRFVVQCVSWRNISACVRLRCTSLGWWVSGTPSVHPESWWKNDTCGCRWVLRPCSWSTLCVMSLLYQTTRVWAIYTEGSAKALSVPAICRNNGNFRNCKHRPRNLVVFLVSLFSLCDIVVYNKNAVFSQYPADVWCYRPPLFDVLLRNCFKTQNAKLWEPDSVA
jgi:hypothetical protein